MMNEQTTSALLKAVPIGIGAMITSSDRRQKHSLLKPGPQSMSSCAIAFVNDKS